MSKEARQQALDLLSAWERGAQAEEYPNEIEALRQALVQPEQDAGKCGCGANLYIDENGKPCSKAQPEQEPVAWHSHNPDYPIQDGDWVEVIFTSGQPDDVKKWTPLYTAPQNPDVTLISEGKTWQGLTDDDLDKCDAHETCRSMRNVAQMLKEKNT